MQNIRRFQPGGTPLAHGEASELYGYGFPLTAKLILVSNPLFLSFPHAWRMLTLQELAEIRPERRLFDLYHYLLIEIGFSLFSMPVAFLADSTIGVMIGFTTMLSTTILAAITCSICNLPDFDGITRLYVAEFGVNFIGLMILASVIERAIFVSQMHVNSPKFRLYCFLAYFISIFWQLANAAVFYSPEFFPFIQGKRLTVYLQAAYHCVLWLIMMVTFGVIFRMKTVDIPRGHGFKIFACMYFCIWYCLQKIWARIRWYEFPFKTVFEPCEKWFSLEIVTEMRQVLRLFVVTMCLMYLYGMELILRSVWYHQDDELSRHPKMSFTVVFPMEVVLLLYVLVLFPITNFIVIPFLNKKFRLTDLRLLGFALVFYNLSYIATMALEWAILGSTVSSPSSVHVTIRVYNCMINPVSMTISSPIITPVQIFIPARMSRAYVNDLPGQYQVILNSTVFSHSLSLMLKAGVSKVYILRDGLFSAIPEMDRQLHTRPDFMYYDSHFFAINCLVNSTKEYLASKNAMVSLRREDDFILNEQIKSDLHHVILKDDSYNITLKLGNDTFDMYQSMNDHGVYSLMFYDSWGGGDQGYELDTVSVGLAYSRKWAHIQILLLAIGMCISQIPSVHFTYKNAPAGLRATCYSFQRFALAVSTFFVWLITSNYGLGPGASSISTMIVILFTVFFTFLSVSDIIPTNDDAILRQSELELERDSLSTASGSVKSVGTKNQDMPDPTSTPKHVPSKTAGLSEKNE